MISKAEIRCYVLRVTSLPIRYTHPDTVVSDGGHVISLTHAAQGNDFINSVVTNVTNKPAGARTDEPKFQHTPLRFRRVHAGEVSYSQHAQCAVRLHNRYNGIRWHGRDDD